MVKVYKSAKEFWTEVSPHLLREEAKNALALGLAYGFRTDARHCLLLAAAFDGKKFLGSVVGSRQFKKVNVLPSAASGEVARELYNAFMKTGSKVNGIVGEVKTANGFKRLFEESGHSVSVQMKQGIYRCRKVVPPHVSRGLVFRKADSADAKKIGAWVEDFQLEAVPHDPPVNGVEFARTKIKEGLIYVIERKGKLLSMAAKARDIGTSCAVNLVYTPKPERGQGYASAVTARLTQQLLKEGRRETMLYTDMANATSNKIYQKIGYKFVCDSVHYGVS